MPVAVSQLLIAAREAAQTCEDEAWRIIRNHDREDADNVGHAAEMRYAALQAADRIDLINNILRPRHASNLLSVEFHS